MKRVLMTALALSAWGCKCGTTRTLAPTFEILEDQGSAERTAVDFGDVKVGGSAVQKVRIRNGGNAALSISEATINPSTFTVASTLPFSVEAGAEGQFELRFSPTVADQRITGTVTLTSNDPMRMTAKLDLAGRGVTAVARPTPATLQFGDVYVGEQKTLMLTLTNAGGNPLPVNGASITGSPAGVTGDFANFNQKMIAPGGSATVPVTFAPMMGTALGPVTGSVVIAIDAQSGGDVTIPLSGRATQALPRMCFKFDDTGTETCTDQATSSLDIQFGALCDNAIYASGPNACTPTNGQRTGKLYFKNEGNIPLSFSAQYRPYIYTSPRCGDGGVARSDFVFSNVPVPDGGAPGPLNMSTSSLPATEAVPKPWETAPITITYRAASACRDEGADQAQVLWTRQDPPTTTPMRVPGTLFATLRGTSLLPAAKAKTLNIGQQGSPADVPLTTPIAVELVTNEGAAPLTLTSVELWEELTAFLPDGGTYDGGGPEGGILSMCNPSSPSYEFSQCARFQWAPGQAPANLLPVTLDGGRTPGNPSQATVGKLFVGCLADGGSCPPAIERYRIVAVVNTTDPYAPRVQVPIVAWVRFRP